MFLKRITLIFVFGLYSSVFQAFSQSGSVCVIKFEDLKRQINTANDSARQAKENAELELKYGNPPDKWLRDLRGNDHKFHDKSKAMEDRVDARPNLPVENLLEGLGKAAKIFTPSEIKGLLGKSE